MHVLLGFSLFASQNMLVTEYHTGTVGSYLIDAKGAEGSLLRGAT